MYHSEVEVNEKKKKDVGLTLIEELKKNNHIHNKVKYKPGERKRKE